METEISGDLSPEDVAALRAELPGVRIAYSTGLSGERLLTLIGSLTVGQAAKLRAFLLRLLGEDRIEGLRITKSKIEIDKVSARHLSDVEAVVDRLLERLQDKS